MPGLRELQAALHARVLGIGTEVDGSIRGDARAAAEERLAVYVNAYHLRLAEVLGKDYPVLAARLGEAGFAGLARAYLAVHPSRHPSVRWFGHALGDFLGDTPPWRDQPALAELARFEWTQGELCDAADDEPVGAQAVAAIAPDAWPEMRFEARAAVRTLALTWSVAAAVRECLAGRSPPALEPLPRPRTWLLWRGSDMLVRWRALDEDERDALEILAAGGTFGEICARVTRCREADDAPLRAAGLLRQWISDEIIANVSIAHPA